MSAPLNPGYFINEIIDKELFWTGSWHCGPTALNEAADAYVLGNPALFNPLKKTADR